MVSHFFLEHLSALGHQAFMLTKYFWQLMVMKLQTLPVWAAYKVWGEKPLQHQTSESRYNRWASLISSFINSQLCTFIHQIIMFPLYLQIWNLVGEDRHHDSGCPFSPLPLADGHSSSKSPNIIITIIDLLDVNIMTGL